MEMSLISYGNGNQFIRSKMKRIRNWGTHKPAGGLWTSPINSRFGWKQLCLESGRDELLDTSFEVQISGNIFIVNNPSDLDKMDWYDEGESLFKFPDFESLLKDGFDAIHLTEDGVESIQFQTARALMGWDCETVLVLNPDCIR